MIEEPRRFEKEGDEILVVEGADIWGYVDLTLAQQHPAGYTVEARDGEIGKVDKHSNEPGSSYLVIDTGPWIFGKKVVLPAGVVERVDPDTETVFVNVAKDDVKNAPEYDDELGVTEDYRHTLGTYYTSHR
jgi:hypothetical protein